MDDKRHFLDTNILLTASDRDRIHHSVCLHLFESALGGKISLYASGQVFREYLVVATRPKENNGLGMNRASALSNVKEFRSCVHSLEETTAVLDRLVNLIRQHRIQGKHIHEANIAATMQENGLNRLVTLNPADFNMFPDIVLLSPDSALEE